MLVGEQGRQVVGWIDVAISYIIDTCIYLEVASYLVLTLGTK